MNRRERLNEARQRGREEAQGLLGGLRRAPGAAGDRAYVELRDVAAACGVPERELHLVYKPAGWGVPQHWKFEGTTLYAVPCLLELAGVLHAAGLQEAAAKLRAWLEALPAGRDGTDGTPGLGSANRTTVAPARDSARAGRPAGWLNEWEAKRE